MEAAHRDKSIASQLREEILRNPRKMTLQLARDFGVPEVDVIRAFPEERAVELTISRWEELLRSLEAFGPVRVIVSNGATTIEASGCFGGFSSTGDFFNVQSESLDMHLRWRELASVFAVEKPGHMGGPATYSVQFFDRSGTAALKVFLNFGEPLAPQHHRLFSELRDRFRASGSGEDTD